MPGTAGAKARRTLADRALFVAHTDIEIAFPDVDAAQIVWHGNYFRYFETARAVLLRVIGYDYAQMRESGFAWPVIDAHARFIKPLTYAQIIRVQAGLTEWENRMKVEYVITDAGTGERLAGGETVQCAVTIDTWELQLVSPPALLERLKNYL